MMAILIWWLVLPTGPRLAMVLTWCPCTRDKTGAYCILMQGATRRMGLATRLEVSVMSTIAAASSGTAENVLGGVGNPTIAIQARLLRGAGSEGRREGKEDRSTPRRAVPEYPDISMPIRKGPARYHRPVSRPAVLR